MESFRVRLTGDAGERSGGRIEKFAKRVIRRGDRRFFHLRDGRKPNDMFPIEHIDGDFVLKLGMRRIEFDQRADRFGVLEVGEDSKAIRFGNVGTTFDCVDDRGDDVSFGRPKRVASRARKTHRPARRRLRGLEGRNYEAWDVLSFAFRFRRFRISSPRQKKSAFLRCLDSGSVELWPRKKHVKEGALGRAPLLVSSFVIFSTDSSRRLLQSASG